MLPNITDININFLLIYRKLRLIEKSSNVDLHGSKCNSFVISQPQSGYSLFKNLSITFGLYVEKDDKVLFDEIAQKYNSIKFICFICVEDAKKM